MSEQTGGGYYPPKKDVDCAAPEFKFDIEIKELKIEEINIFNAACEDDKHD